MKKRETPPAAAEKTALILCSCGGTLFSDAQGEKIASGIRGGPGCPSVLLSPAACSPGELSALAGGLRRERVGRAVFAGCSLRERQDVVEGFARKAGFAPSSLRSVNLHAAAFRRLRGREAVKEAVSSIKRALGALLLQPPFEVRRVPLAQEILVIGSGSVGQEAARAARALGHPTTLVAAAAGVASAGVASAGVASAGVHAAAAGRAPSGEEWPIRGRLLGLEGQVGAFRGRIATPSGLQTVGAGAVIVADDAASEPAGGEPPVVALGALAAAVKALPRRSAVRPVGIMLDREIDETRASTEAALQLALDLQDHDRVQVYLFCRDIRVAALPLEALYDRARGAGVAVVPFTGVPRLEPGPRGVTVTVQDSVLGETLSLQCDLVSVSAGGMASQADRYRDLAARTGVSPDGLGRLQNNNIQMFPEKTNRPGVFVIGPCRGEDYEPQGLREAQAAALAAHELLAAGSMDVELSQPVVDADKCVLCLTCIRSCPFQAMQVASGKSAAESIPEVCQRCGTCAGECPAKAIELPVYSDQIMASLLA